MSNLMGMLTTIQSYVWGPPTLLLLIGTGLYFTIKLRGTADHKISTCSKASFLKKKVGPEAEKEMYRHLRLYVQRWQQT
ncbi:MAG: hypothetical protein ACLR2O_13525 [Coprococcus sp.]